MRIALTFDNGPTPGITESVVETLARFEVTACFFAIGEKLATTAGRQAAARVLEDGHSLGGHTWSHSVPFGELAAADADREIDRTCRVVEAVGGDPTLFRPYGVGGAMDDRLMSTHAARRLIEGGFTCVLWTSVPGDWLDPKGWVDKASNDIAQADWSVVALHDLPVGALYRLDDFITRSLDLGAEFVSSSPDSCTPIREGVPTVGFDLLGVGPAESL